MHIFDIIIIFIKLNFFEIILYIFFKKNIFNKKKIKEKYRNSKFQ